MMARRTHLAAVVWVLAVVCPFAAAQTAEEQAIIASIDFEQDLDAQVPLDARFTDE
jgi:hypothetical protein